MPFLVDRTVSLNAVTALLTVIALLIGVLVAIQGSAALSLSAVDSRSLVNKSAVDDLTQRMSVMERNFSDFKQENNAFQAEMRNSLLGISTTINDLKVEQVRKHK